jgi:hypothetical protein
MRETAPDEFAVVWKVPARGDFRLALHVRLPDTCKAKSERVGSIEGAAFFERWTVTCPGSINHTDFTSHSGSARDDRVRRANVAGGVWNLFLARRRSHFERF